MLTNFKKSHIKVLIFCAFLLLSTLSVASGDSVNEDPDVYWTQFQHDSLRTGATYTTAPYSDPLLLWRGTTGTALPPISVSPLITDEMVYIFASGGNICAYSKAKGDLVWTSETKEGLLQSSIPAYGNGKIIAAVNDRYNNGYLFALNSSNGDELWNLSVTKGNFACPVTYFDHRIYVAEGLKGGISTKYYYCYDDKGNMLWKYANNDTAGFLWCGASIIEDYIVYPTHEGKLVSLYRTNGTFVDEVDLTTDLSFSKSDLGRIRASVSYNNGYIYTTSEDTYTEGYIWKVGFDPVNGLFIDDGWAIRRGFSTSTPAVHDGKVYVGQGEHGYTGNLTCLDASNGSLLWSYPTDAGVKSSPVISIQENETYIYFTGAATNNSLYCINQEGQLAWQYNPPNDYGYILQGAAISDGKVFFGTGGGYLYCLKEAPHESPIPDFNATPTSGSDKLTVAFADHSTNYPTTWNWDMDSDGIIDHTDQNPTHYYDASGVYTVTLNVTNIYGNNILTKTDYIIVEADWNPWNDPRSEGIPDGTYITISEVINAYNCFRNGIPAPGTDTDIDYSTVIDLYNAFRYGTPM